MKGGKPIWVTASPPARTKTTLSFCGCWRDQTAVVIICSPAKRGAIGESSLAEGGAELVEFEVAEVFDLFGEVVGGFLHGRVAREAVGHVLADGVGDFGVFCGVALGVAQGFKLRDDLTPDARVTRGAAIDGFGDAFVVGRLFLEEFLG